MCDISFIVDSMSGKVAKWLRILGCDTLYVKSSISDSNLLKMLEGRVLVTRDKELKIRAEKLGKKAIIIPENILEALALISKEFSVSLRVDPKATRCPFCNTKLISVKRNLMAGKLPREISNGHTKFLLCPSCGKTFWFGTHYWNMLNTLSRVKEKKSHYT